LDSARHPSLDLKNIVKTKMYKIYKGICKTLTPHIKTIKNYLIHSSMALQPFVGP
jgi:hypothetical protein